MAQLFFMTAILDIFYSDHQFWFASQTVTGINFCQNALVSILEYVLFTINLKRLCIAFQPVDNVYVFTKITKASHK